LVAEKDEQDNFPDVYSRNATSVVAEKEGIGGKAATAVAKGRKDLQV